MKFLKIVFIFAILNLMNTTILTQWYWLNSNTIRPLSGITFLDDNTGYASGNSGTFIKTTNAGFFWVSIPTGVNIDLSDVIFINSNTGFLVGGNGSPAIILKTTNGGQNWSNQLFGTNASFDNIVFPSQDTGYIVGPYSPYLIYKTTNQGENWFSIEPVNHPSYLLDIYFINNNTGFVVGSGGGVYKTENGGSTWNLDSIPNSGFLGLNSVFFINGTTGFTSGSSISGDMLFKTTNCGDNWSLIPFISDRPFYCIFFPSLDTGYILSTGIYKTIDQGNNWSHTSFFSFYDIFFTNNNTGYACGTSGMLIKTTTGGGNLVDVLNTSTTIPDKSALYDNYPNPFNPVTKISYYIYKESYVNLYVFDITGREIKRLVKNKVQEAGNYDFNFDGMNISSGIYFYRLEAIDKINNRFIETKKMILVK